MADTFERCGKSGGVQATLVPVAVVALLVYVLGFPAALVAVLWQNRERIMEDQLLRAKGTGDDRLSNPNAFVLRTALGRMYYQFKPDAFYWTVVIILRTFFIALAPHIFAE